jgi:hypothetical protein
MPRRLTNFVVILAVVYPTFAQALELRRYVEPGKPKRMFSYASWGPNCDARNGVVELLTKPQHGQATSRRTVGIVHFNRFSDHCLGATVPHFEVWYTPEPGYHGSDSLQVERTLWNGRTDIDTFSIEVR